MTLPRLITLSDVEAQAILTASSDDIIMQGFQAAAERARSADEAFREAQWDQGLLKAEMDRRLEAARAQHPLQQFLTERGIKPQGATNGEASK